MRPLEIHIGKLGRKKVFGRTGGRRGPPSAGWKTLIGEMMEKEKALRFTNFGSLPGLVPSSVTFYNWLYTILYL